MKRDHQSSVSTRRAESPGRMPPSTRFKLSSEIPPQAQQATPRAGLRVSQSTHRAASSSRSWSTAGGSSKPSHCTMKRRRVNCLLPWPKHDSAAPEGPAIKAAQGTVGRVRVFNDDEPMSLRYA